MLPRIYSLAALIAVWALAAALAQSRLLPGPLAIGATILADISSGELPYQIGCTLARVISSFAIAMALGIIAGYAMGRSRTVDRYADPWLVVLLNMPALFHPAPSDSIGDQGTVHRYLPGAEQTPDQDMPVLPEFFPLRCGDRPEIVQ